MSHLVAVNLHGSLGEQFGRIHHFAVRSPREAVQAMDANYPGFLREFAKNPEYWIVCDGDLRSGEHAGVLPVSKEMHFVPKVEGNQFIGPMLVGAVFPSLAGTLGAQIIGGLLMSALFIGLSMLIAPKKKDDDEKKTENYAFTGPENVTGQGVPVPLVYGRVFAGSVVASAGLDLGVDFQPDVPPAPPSSPGDYNTSVVPGTPSYPGGFPAIVAYKKTVGTPPLPTKEVIEYGPAGWVKVGTRTASSMEKGTTGAYTIKTETVDVWRSKIQQATFGPYWEWDRINGYQTYSQTSHPS
jgi:predicted phage tail protein